MIVFVSSLVFAILFLWFVPHGMVYGWRYTLKMPGGLVQAINDEWTTRGELCPNTIFIHRHGHYSHVSIDVVCAVVSLVPKGHVTIPRGTKAYRTLSSLLEATPTMDEFRSRQLGREDTYL